MKQDADKTDSDSLEIGERDPRHAYQSMGDMILPYLMQLWAVRRKFALVNGAVLILAIIFQLLFVRPYFESTITILPDYGNKSSMSGGLSGLAAMAGVSLQESASPADIYENLLTSPSILEPVVFAHYKTSKFGDSVNLVQYFEIEPDADLPTDARNRKMYLEVQKKLTGDVINTMVEKMTKILTVTVRMPESKLSADVANRLVQSLDAYVRTKKTSNASEQRSYIEKRVSQLKDSMTSSENNLQKFQEANRVISQSPELAIEQSRLTLQVQILQGVYGELIRQLEIAKIDEIRDAPILSIREFARDPMKKAGPSRLRSYR
jgi:uncharacterized protein involved in exopolysaccharide biosynthesis